MSGSGPTGQFTYDASTLLLTEVNIDWGGGWFNWVGSGLITTTRPYGFDFVTWNARVPPDPVRFYRVDFSVYLDDLTFLAHACAGPTRTDCFEDTVLLSGHGSLVAVPEASSVWLLLVGVIGILGTRQLTGRNSTYQAMRIPSPAS